VHWKVKEGRVKIGEMAKLTNTSTKTIRFYEDSGLLPAPARSASGYRDYGPEIVDRLRFIHRGQAAGLTLQKVRQILAIHDRGEAPCGHVRQVLNSRLDQVRAQIGELVALEGHLQSLVDRASRGAPTEHDHSTVCWILESDLGEPGNVELTQVARLEPDGYSTTAAARPGPGK
jgi:DNA-binding transcriptional MerR regulator